MGRAEHVDWPCAPAGPCSTVSWTASNCRRVSTLAFRLLPQQTRLKIGIPALARLLKQHSDIACRVADHGNHFEYIAERCADCWGRTSKGPVCNLTVGLLLEAMSSFGRGQEFRVTQRECRAAGAAACVFHLDKEPIA